MVCISLTSRCALNAIYYATDKRMSRLASNAEKLMKNSSNAIAVQLTLLIVSTLTVMSNATISPSLPVMREHFNNVENSDYLVRLVLTIPSLCVAIAAPGAGILVDQLGRKRLLAAGLVLYGLAGSSGLWLNSIGLILVGRSFLGLSVAAIMISATTLIADYYSGAIRTRFLGWQSAAMALGGFVFVSVGGILADIGWRLPFLIYLAALVLLPLVLLFLPEPRRDRSFTTAANDADPTHLPLGLVVFTCAIALIVQAMYYIVPVQLPFYLQQLTNASASQSGFAIASSTLFIATSSILHQRFKARFSFITIYEMGFLSMGVGFGLISLANGYVIVLLGLAIAGFGVGLVVPNMNLCLTSITPSLLRGRVLGSLTTCFFLGQFLSPLLSQPLSERVGLATTYALAGGLLIFLGGATFVVMSRHRQWA